MLARAGAASGGSAQGAATGASSAAQRSLARAGVTQTSGAAPSLPAAATATEIIVIEDDSHEARSAESLTAEKLVDFLLLAPGQLEKRVALLRHLAVTAKPISEGVVVTAAQADLAERWARQRLAAGPGPVPTPPGASLPERLGDGDDREARRLAAVGGAFWASPSPTPSPSACIGSIAAAESIDTSASLLGGSRPSPASMLELLGDDRVMNRRGAEATPAAGGGAYSACGASKALASERPASQAVSTPVSPGQQTASLLELLADDRAMNGRSMNGRGRREAEIRGAEPTSSAGYHAAVDNTSNTVETAARIGAPEAQVPADVLFEVTVGQMLDYMRHVASAETGKKVLLDARSGVSPVVADEVIRRFDLEVLRKHQ